MKVVFLSFVFLFLSACATRQCDALPPLKQPVTVGQLVEHDQRVVAMYAVCSNKK